MYIYTLCSHFGSRSSTSQEKPLHTKMALMLSVDGSSERHTDIQKAVDEFMNAYTVEWLTLQSRPVEEGETPWHHPKLVRVPVEEGEIPWQVEEGEPDPEHYDWRQWSFVTQAIVSDTGRRDCLLRNSWCLDLFGPILVYTSCICDYDGSQYKCEISMEEDVCTQLLHTWIARHAVGAVLG